VRSVIHELSYRVIKIKPYHNIDNFKILQNTRIFGMWGAYIYFIKN